MKSDETSVLKCRGEICSSIVGTWRAKITGATPDDIDAMASWCIDQTLMCYDRMESMGRKPSRSELKREVKAEFRKRYGSIWLMLLFSVVWKLIELWLLK